MTSATTSTQKLIESLKNNSTMIIGKESIASDGTKYRYDRYVLNNEASNWLVILFEKAAAENGFHKYCTQISINETISIAHDRPKFKGNGNGKISMSVLVEF
jgi:hypothetical protein